jgi:NAD(P)-dependent dehydrogenase (short-subunit alcohol dehydrogenase family)
MTRNLDWRRLEGIVLLNHGIFSFADDAKTSYERMIKLVDDAERYLHGHGAVVPSGSKDRTRAAALDDLVTMAKIRKYTSLQFGAAIVTRMDDSDMAVDFSNLPNVSEIAGRGPLTPDHVIRTKSVPVIIKDEPQQDVATFAQQYRRYFETHTNGALTCLDPAPRWAVWPKRGVLAFGRSVKDADVILDIARHTLPAIQRAEHLGGWQVLDPRDLFEVEYWELEQAKLKKPSSPPVLQGKVAVVTGADRGIGRACVEHLLEQGAAVIGLDVHDGVTTLSSRREFLGQVCDITDQRQVQTSIENGVRAYGGIDILVNNAGIFPAGGAIAELDQEIWQRSLEINLSAQQTVLQTCIPFLKHGLDPSVIFVASKNVSAPGPGAAAYSVAKAGVTQLARVAALELAEFGIRVNVLHPDAVYDTGIWTPEVLENRARHYGLTVQAYKTKNLLGTEITSKDVAALICALAGPLFAKTTGAQIPIDGGNERVI